MNNLILPASVRATTVAPHLSSRYVRVDSGAVVDAMLERGFQVHSVNTQGPRMRDPLHSRHVIEFRLPESPVVGGAVPRVLFGNSHDGSTTAYAMSGVFRFVCSNGLVVGSMYGKEYARHTGDAARDLVERMQALARNTAPLFQQIEGWSRQQLTAPQRKTYAQLAAQLRWGDAHRFEVKDLLQVRRAEDDAGDLWTTFNRIQEATTRGGDHLTGLTRSGRTTTARAINEPNASVKFNAQLWSLTDEFAQAI